MSVGVEKSWWSNFSEELSAACEALSESIVAVDTGRRVAASGICWNKGVVVTASHLVRDDADPFIRSAAGLKIKGELVGRDPGLDLAVLKTAPEAAIQPVQQAEAASLRVGEWVVAVARSTRGELAASAGIIARLGDSWTTWRGTRIDQLIRPDVTLYPGQSGSALVTFHRRVAGMNTSALVRAAAITVPASTISRTVDELLEKGYVARPYLGVATQPVAVPPDLSVKLGETASGALLVVHVEPNGPAARAGVMLGDLLVRFEEQPLEHIERLREELGKRRPGMEVALTLVRGGERKNVKVTIGELPPRRAKDH